MKYVNVLVCLVVAMGLVFVMVQGCGEDEVFESIGDRVVYPSAVVSDGTYFYVVNSDLERQYNSGSVMVVDAKGHKRGVIAAPRLGRFVVVHESILLVGHGKTDQYKTPPQLRAYDVSDPEKIRLITSVTLGCTPINAVARKDYPYFVVSCMNGQLYLGKWVDSETDSEGKPFELNLVRDYGPHPRRALFIDTKRHLVYAFPTDVEQTRAKDVALEDSQTTLDSGSVLEENPNEIPDKWEGLADLTEVERRDLVRQFQYAVYPIYSEQKRDFPYAAAHSNEVQQEMHWLYFYDDASAQTKVYRTNFWQALPDPLDADAFYMSKRSYENKESTSVGNAIYRFVLKASPYAGTASSPMKTSDVFAVKRVWGHDPRRSVVKSKEKSNVSFDSSTTLRNRDIRFTGNFDLGNMQRVMEAEAHESFGYLVVNDFRDSVNFPNSSYALSLKKLSSGKGKKDSFLHFSTQRSQSFFAIATLGSLVMAGAFFSDNLALFQVEEDFSLKLIKRIR